MLLHRHLLECRALLGTGNTKAEEPTLYEPETQLQMDAILR